MKTTEIFVEQVLIGSIVLAIVALPWFREIAAGPFSSNNTPWATVTGIGAGAVLLGLVYLVGVVFDRLADSIMVGWERHMRLRFANKYERGPGSDDPFDEGKFRSAILIKGGGAVDWIDYLRTRVRLARSVAVLLPGLTCAAQIAIVRTVVAPDKLSRHGLPANSWNVDLDRLTDLTSPYFGFLFLAVYPVVMVLGAGLLWLRLSTQGGKKGATQKPPNPIEFSEYVALVWMPPKTDETKRRNNYLRVRGLKGGRDKIVRRATFNFVDTFISVPSVGYFSLLAFSIYFCRGVKVDFVIETGIAGFSLALLATWAWWRMMRTYMTYLKSIGTPLRRELEIATDQN